MFRTPFFAPSRRLRALHPAVVFAAVLLLATCLPYLIAARNSNADWQFSGHLLGVEDGNSYLGKMRLGAHGELVFSLFYTREASAGTPGEGALLFLPYILTGWVIGGFVPESSPGHTTALIIGFHLLRLLCGGLMLWATYRFISRFLDTRSQRLTAFILATLGGGLGWLVALLSAVSGQGDWLGSAPPEFYIPEGFSFLTLFSLPHLALARAVLLAGFLFLFAALARRSTPAPFTSARRWLISALCAGACWLVVGLAVPFFLTVVYALLGAWGLAVWVRRRAFPADLIAPFLISAGITLPLFLLYAYQFTASPLFAQWSAQNQLPSPHPLHYLMAYLLLFVPALWGVRWAWKRSAWASDGADRVRYLLLLAWVAAAAIMVYLPINVQRRTTEGVLVALAILAAAGLSSGRKPLMTALWVGAASLSSAFVLLGAFSTAGGVGRPIFQPAPLVRAMTWLNAHADAVPGNRPPVAIVLSSPAGGNAVPAYGRLRVVMGHGPETLFWPQKTEQVHRFYAGEMADDERQAFLAGAQLLPGSALTQDPITYIFYTPAERAFGGGDPPDWAEQAELIYEEGEYAIYRVR